MTNKDRATVLIEAMEHPAGRFEVMVNCYANVAVNILSDDEEVRTWALEEMDAIQAAVGHRYSGSQLRVPTTQEDVDALMETIKGEVNRLNAAPAENIHEWLGAASWGAYMLMETCRVVTDTKS